MTDKPSPGKPPAATAPDPQKVVDAFGRAKEGVRRQVLRLLGLTTAVDPRIVKPEDGGEWPEIELFGVPLGRGVIMSTTEPGKRYRLTVTPHPQTNPPVTVVTDTGVMDYLLFTEFVNDSRITAGMIYNLLLEVHPDDYQAGDGSHEILVTAT
jgi:hypothetical protein